VDYSRPELADRLAAEYVAGTLRGAARRRFEGLLSAHPLLNGAVRKWQACLMPLTISIPPERPSVHVWKRIEARIGQSSQKTERSQTLWTQLAFWRAFSGFATVASVTFAVLLASPRPAQPPMVVVLSVPSETAAVNASFVASISADGRAMVTKPITNVNVQADRALELWAVPSQGGPRSLGLISANGPTVVQRDRLLKDTAALAVSLEPSGGSPTGGPTGPILYVGKLSL
jgi:anti-sigma-K factor RskA